MGIYQTLFTDPSDGWPAQRAVPLVLDMRDMSLNGVRLGDSAHALMPFGRPSNKRPFKAGRFAYKEIGFVAESEDARITSLGVTVVPDDTDDLGPARLDIILPSGARISVDGETPASMLTAEVGEPVEVDRDEEEIVASYSLHDCELEFECSTEGHLKRINWR